MRKLYWLVLFVFGVSVQGFSQNYFAVTDGPWSDLNTWANSRGGTPGFGVPGVGATVYTEGYEITVDQDVTVLNLAVRSTNIGGSGSSQLIFGGLFDPYTITITGILTSANALGAAQAPLESVLEDTGNLIIRLTSTNTTGAIQNWSYNAPINTLHVNPPSGVVLTQNAAGGALAITENLTILSGTFRPRRNIADAYGYATINVAQGATLDLEHAQSGSVTGNGVLGTKFNSIEIDGTVNVGGTNNCSLSTDNITISGTGVLNVSFNGANQNEGWWYQTVRPSSGSLNAASTVNFTASATQNVYAWTYGNLNLSGNGNKTFVGSNTMDILGDFSILSSDVSVNSTRSIIFRGNVNNDGTFSSIQPVSFQGSKMEQKLEGSPTSTYSFNNGLTVNKTTGVVIIEKDVAIANGIAVSAGSINLGDITTTLSSGVFTISNGASVLTEPSGVLIVSGSSTFTGNGTLTLSNLTITGTATINKSAWSITGNLVNNGSLVLPSTSTVTFSGGAAQSISGNTFSIGNITVNKTSSILSNNANVRLLGLLTVTTGTFNVNGSGSGNLILNSDTNGDARIGPMAGGSITGQVTFERYFENTSNRWRNLAFPVTGVTHTTLGTQFPIHTNSLSYYNETVTGNVDMGWVYVNSGTLNNSGERGYTAWMYNIAPITISVKGPLVSNTPKTGGAPHNFNVKYTPSSPILPSDDGWNFVPNPFACPINWNNSGWTKTRVNAVAAIWDIENNVYQYTGAGWDGVVAQGQAFWVQTNAASPELKATEAVKAPGVTKPTFYRVGSQSDRLMISIKSDQYTDKAVVRFIEDATMEFDSEYDASKLQNPIFNLSTLTKGGLSLAINALPKGPCSSNVFLNITNIEPGNYSLDFTGLDSFTDLQQLLLVDHFTNTNVKLSELKSYQFAVSNDKNSFGAGRFELIFGFADTTPAELSISRSQEVIVSNYNEGEYQWYLNGEVIQRATESVIRPVVNGQYSLELTYKGCVLRSQELQVEDMTYVYPNPVISGNVRVQVGGLIASESGRGEIAITSPLGQTVRKESFGKQDITKVIDMRGVSSGQYIVSIVAEGRIIQRVKLIVQ